MKLQAATRLRARLGLPKIEALLNHPVRNTSQRGYLAVIGNMLTGDRPIGRDCRSVCARYIAHNLSTNAVLILVGHPNSDEPFHCLLVSGSDGRVVADAYSGTYTHGHYTYTTTSNEKVEAVVVAAIPVKELMRHLVNGTFAQWANRFPN